jgi:hypothetical protein
MSAMKRDVTRLMPGSLFTKGVHFNLNKLEETVFLELWYFAFL